MLGCWELEPKNRPIFSEVVDSLSKSLETMADYVKVIAFEKERTANQIGDSVKSDRLALLTEDMSAQESQEVMTELPNLTAEDIQQPHDMTTELISEETKV